MLTSAAKGSEKQILTKFTCTCTSLTMPYASFLENILFQFRNDQCSSLRSHKRTHLATDLRKWRFSLGIRSSFSTGPQKPVFYLKPKCIAAVRRYFSMVSAESEYTAKIWILVTNKVWVKIKGCRLN